MTAHKERTPKRRPGRGALLAIGTLFIASGLIRIVDGTGLALAREVEAMAASRTQQEPLSNTSPPECPTEDGLGQALASIRERQEALDTREKLVERRMVSLKQAEIRITQDLAALVEAETALSETLATADGAAERDIAGLIAVYERMKPKDAAAVFDTMDPSFAAGFLARMRPDAAAAVMAGLSPAKAYSVSILLAGRNLKVPTE